MVRRFSVNFAIFSILMDGVVVCLALLAATFLRPSLGFVPLSAPFPLVIPTPYIMYPIFAIEWVAINLLFNVYDGRRNIRPVEEFISLTLSALLAAIALAGTLYLSYREVSRLLFLTFVTISYLGMLGWRETASLFLKLTHTPAVKIRRVLIAGAGQVGRELEAQIILNPALRLEVVGFLDDDPQKQALQPDILGSLDAAPSLIAASQIDDIVIALPQRAYQRLNQLVSDLHPLPVKIWVIPDYFRLALHKATIDEFAGIPMLDLRAPALNDYQRLVKRAFDLLIASTSLLLGLPWMGLIALAIRLDSQGPVIFRQARVGENGRIFGMYKFRTMVANAEELRHVVEHKDAEGNILHKSADDPRITRLGGFLRRRSLDELPQLLNVILGDMSMVGPRPELPYLVEKYEPWQRARFAVPQGITGWWQIHGRSDRPMHLNTDADLYYVQNYSLLLDIYILVKTMAVVWSGKGAF